MRLIDVKILSRLLCVREKTIYDWVYRGLIPHYKVGRKLVRFDYSEIKKWIEDKKPTNFKHVEHGD